MKIGIPNKAFSKNLQLINQLKTFDCEVKLNKEDKRFDGKDLINFLEDCEIAIIGLEKINESVLKNLPKLKFISKFGVGMNNINLNDIELSKVKFAMTSGVNKRAVSEITLSFILSLIRNTHKTSIELKSGVWNKNGGFGLSGLKVGIIGFGNIGQDLVKLLAPFETTILVNDIVEIDPKKYNYKINVVTKETIYKESDIITLHLPLTSETHDLINQKVFNKMKKGSFLVNTSRGGIVNEKDLFNAIQNKIISGAALDVFENEPPTFIELIRDERLICTPHIAGNSDQAVLNMGKACIENIKIYLSQNEI